MENKINIQDSYLFDHAYDLQLSAKVILKNHQDDKICEYASRIFYSLGRLNTFIQFHEKIDETTAATLRKGLEDFYVVLGRFSEKCLLKQIMTSQ